MTGNDLVAKAMEYLSGVIAPRLSDPFKQFKIGMVVGGLGRRKIEAAASALFADFTDENGVVDVAGLKRAVLSGFGAAKALHIADLGLSLDAKDAEDFFARL